MSPEQCRGKNVDHRTDLYSLGVLAHEALTGKPPFDGDNVMEILFKQTSAPAPPMSTVCPAIPASLDPPVLALLEKEPANRPRSALEAIEEIAKAANAAGFAVTLAPQPAGPRASGPRPFTPSGLSGSGMTPAQLGDLAAAPTLVQVGSNRTLTGAASEAKPAASSRTVVYAVALVACLGGAGVGLAWSRGSGAAAAPPATMTPATMTPATMTPATMTPATTTSATTAPAMTSAAPASSSASLPDEPANVELTIESNAPHVDVYEGTSLLGSGPGAIKVPRRESPLKLTFKAAGFKPSELTVSATKNDVVKVELTKPSPVSSPVSSPAQKKVNKDLEY
jgi:serine/threonine-protein kinase